MSIIQMQCPDCFHWHTGTCVHAMRRKAAENAAFDAAIRAEHEAHRVKHEVCPCCGQNNYRETCIGYLGKGRDPNRRTCMSCKCQWMAPEILTPGKEIPNV